MLMIFSHHTDEGGTTAVWRGTGMVGHCNVGLTRCGNEGRRAEKGRANRVIFELEEAPI